MHKLEEIFSLSVEKVLNLYYLSLKKQLKKELLKIAALLWISIELFSQKIL